MVGITELSALMTSLKGAKDLAEAMVGLRDAAAFQGKVIEFQGLILDAQQRVFAVQEERTSLIAEVGALKEKLAAHENWDAEKKRYEMKVLHRGIVVYSLKEGMENGEPPHSICANCYQKAKKSILHTETRFPGRYQAMFCKECGFEGVISGVRG